MRSENGTPHRFDFVLLTIDVKMLTISLDSVTSPESRDGFTSSESLINFSQ